MRTIEQEVDNDSVYKILKNSSKKIIETLKSLAYEKRYKILLALLESDKEFHELQQATDISKTALSHHLNDLIEQDLVLKPSRGSYVITYEGRQLLRHISRYFSGNLTETNFLSLEEKQKQKKSLSLSDYLEGQYLYEENEVSSDPTYKGGWNSFISSTSGILESLGVIDDYIGVSGRTGICFLVNMTKGDTSFLGDRLLSQKAWEEIFNGIRSYGYEIHEWQSEKITRSWDLVGEDYEKAQEVFNRVRYIIDSFDTPVIVWGLRLPGYGIVKGYTEKSYLVSTHYRHEARNYDGPIQWDSLRPIYQFQLFYITKEETDISWKEGDRQAIERAVKMAKGIDVAPSTRLMGYNLATGLKAYDEWIDVLSNISSMNRVGMEYLVRYYHDAKNVACVFLERLARNYVRYPQSKHLRQASLYYRRAKVRYEELIMLFPYYYRRKSSFDQKNIDRGIELLSEIKELELKAIEELEQANKLWSFDISYDIQERYREPEKKYKK